MKKYRKIPEAPVTAMQVPPPVVRPGPIDELATELKKIADWCGGVVHLTFPDRQGSTYIAVNTIRGSENALLGAWIVRDAAGNFAIYEQYMFDRLFTPVEE